MWQETQASRASLQSRRDWSVFARLPRTDSGPGLAQPSPDCLPSESSARAARVRRQGCVRVAGRGRSHARRVLLSLTPRAVRAAVVAELADSERTLSSRVTDRGAQRGSGGRGGRPCTDRGEPGSPGARGRLLRLPGPGGRRAAASAPSVTTPGLRAAAAPPSFGAS